MPKRSQFRYQKGSSSSAKYTSFITKSTLCHSSTPSGPSSNINSHSSSINVSSSIYMYHFQYQNFLVPEGKFSEQKIKTVTVHKSTAKGSSSITTGNSNSTKSPTNSTKDSSSHVKRTTFIFIKVPVTAPCHNYSTNRTNSCIKSQFQYQKFYFHKQAYWFQY